MAATDYELAPPAEPPSALDLGEIRDSETTWHNFSTDASDTQLPTPDVIIGEANAAPQSADVPATGQHAEFDQATGDTGQVFTWNGFGAPDAIDRPSPVQVPVPGESLADIETGPLWD